MTEDKTRFMAIISSHMDELYSNNEKRIANIVSQSNNIIKDEITNNVNIGNALKKNQLDLESSFMGIMNSTGQQYQETLIKLEKQTEVRSICIKDISYQLILQIIY